MLACACGLGAQPAAPPASPFAGAWKLGLNESELKPPGPPRGYSNTRIYEDRGGGLMLHTIVYSYEKGAGFAFAAVDTDTLAYTDRQDGRISGKGICTVSKDGEKMTESVINFDKMGKETSSSVLVYDRQ